MEGWIELAYPAVHRPAVELAIELAISQPRVRRLNRYITEPPSFRINSGIFILL